ncbi:amino acid transporter AVT6A-like [Populus alba x Populus x berolinensis]|nr:amino acid transporter AVT6A-like [Populus alba x Populus x berolinensis]
MTVMSSNDIKYRRSPRISHLPQKHDDYEPLEVGFNGASFSGAVFNLSTTIVGAGIMALPSTVKQLGLIPGIIMILMGAALTETSIDMILRFGRASKTATYSGVVADSFGGFWRTLLQICIVINNLGMLIVYMIIIGDVLSGTWSDGVRHSGVMEEWFNQHWWTTRCSLLLFTTVFVFAPLISFKHVDSLRYTSALAVGLAIVFVAITAGVAVVKLTEGTIGMPRLMPEVVDQTSFWKLFTTVPIIVTAYICHHNVHPIENELKDHTHMKSIVRTSLTLCSSVYIATSFFGVLLFGDTTLDDVLANFDGDLGVPYSSLLDDVVRVSYGVHLMLVFPIVFFSLRLNLDELLFPFATPIAYDNRRFFLMTSALMGFIFLGANFVPNIWDAFQFTGATAAIAVGFIFPAAIALRDMHGIATKNDRRASWVLILLAVSSSTAAICSDIYSIFTSDSGIKS